MDTPPKAEDILSMSDEDILNMTHPSAEEGGNQTVEEEEESEAPADTGNNGDTENASNTSNEEVSAPAADEPVAGAEAASTEVPAESTETKAEDKPGNKPDDKGGNDPVGSNPEPKADQSQEQAAVAVTPEQATEFYQKVMAPFKANGKMIQARTPDEVIQLMQMGANYTKKLQDIQPHRKVLMMLQNNDLLDEDKLSYLIDLDRRDPAAIRKLVKDSGIDPMDIDVSEDPGYLPGNHQVSDEAVAFKQALEELTSNESGQATVVTINSTWDEPSKELLWKHPEMMAIIHEQRENGVYDTITAEMDRRRILGQIPPNTPFLQAYHQIGNELMGSANPGGSPGSSPQANPAGNQNPAGSAPAVVATRVAAPKSPVANEDKASAASSTRGSPRKAEALVNPLQMSDEEFLSSFKGRL